MENLSMWRAADGDWHLMYSGNNWDSARYATGIARCGAGLNPIRGLPGNHQGPGGMDVFAAADGSERVVWHWWNGSTRFPMTGVLTRPSTGFLVS
ncbi:hypothetical protein ABZY58_04945 [Micromonospora tulbaghiae]|uniref:hypothetical protein n=1 Tax=Micromonospora tulbaghiae TaxID=479978 RepID=UPI0033BACE7B